MRQSFVWVLRDKLASFNILTDLSHSQLVTGSVVMIWNNVLMFGKKSWSMWCRTFSGESNSFATLASTSHFLFHSWSSASSDLMQGRSSAYTAKMCDSYCFCNTDVTSWEGSRFMNSVISCEEAASKQLLSSVITKSSI